jgi:hypothetical protein
VVAFGWSTDPYQHIAVKLWLFSHYKGMEARAVNEKNKESYNSDPARIRSLLGILGAFWEQHPDLSLMDLLAFHLETTCKTTDAELSDRITRKLNAELASALLHVKGEN